MIRNRKRLVVASFALSCSLAVGSTGLAQVPIMGFPLSVPTWSGPHAASVEVETIVEMNAIGGNGGSMIYGRNSYVPTQFPTGSMRVSRMIQGQVQGEFILPSTRAVSPQHIGGGPVDLNHLSADVLNCDVCRQRLGLPPLSTSPSDALPKVPSPAAQAPTTDPKSAHPKSAEPVKAAAVIEKKSVPMLGSPGMISSGAAARLAMDGMVVEEFIPPEPKADAINLGGLPLEVRQQFLHSLDLPTGARVMSAEIQGVKSQPSKSESTKELIEAKSEDKNKTRGNSELPKTGALGTPGIVSQKEQEIKVAPPVNVPSVLPKADDVGEPIPSPKPKLEALQSNETTVSESSESKVPANPSASGNVTLTEAAAQERIQAALDERDRLSKERDNLNSKIEQIQSEWKKRLDQSDAANREAVAMLEKRTAEISELQLKLNSQQEAIAKAKSSSESRSNDIKSKKPDAKKPDSKKESSKGKSKKPEKSGIDE